MTDIVGQRLRRPDAPDKVKGPALYIDDLAFAGSLLAGVLRSPPPHARIVDLGVTQASPIPGVRAILTARDLPGQNLIPMIQPDWPVLAGEFVRHVGEAVALVAAEDPAALKRAPAAIVVDYEPRGGSLDLEEALVPGGASQHWKDRGGGAGLAMTPPDLAVVEGTVRTPYLEQSC